MGSILEATSTVFVSRSAQIKNGLGSSRNKSPLLARLKIPSIKENQDIITVHKKSGEQRTFTGGPVKPMTHEELTAKYYRLADFMRVDRRQAERAIQQWTNLKGVKDIGDAIQTVAQFGQPRPLSDKSPGRIA